MYGGLATALIRSLIYNYPRLNNEIRGWSEEFSASTIDGKTIGKIFFSKLVHLS